MQSIHVPFPDACTKQSRSWFKPPPNFEVDKLNLADAEFSVSSGLIWLYRNHPQQEEQISSSKRVLLVILSIRGPWLTLRAHEKRRSVCVTVWPDDSRRIVWIASRRLQTVDNRTNQLDRNYLFCLPSWSQFTDIMKINQFQPPDKKRLAVIIDSIICKSSQNSRKAKKWEMIDHHSWMHSNDGLYGVSGP
jgi:hypothetical protein